MAAGVATDEAEIDKEAHMGKGTELVSLNDYAISKLAPAQLSEIIKANIGGNLTPDSLQKITMPTSGSTTWLVPSVENPDGFPVKDLEGVIIYQHDCRALFAKGAKGVITHDPPLCVSGDAITGEGTPGGTCDGCAQSAWGSSGPGEKGQACKSLHRMYLITATSILPFVLTLSPTSLAPWRKYMVSLINGGLRVSGIVTRLGLTKVEGGPAPYARIVPSYVRTLTEDEQKEIDDYAASIVPALKKGYAAPEIDDEQLEQVA